MNFKYTTTIVLLLMILALSRGVALHYQDFIHFDAFTAHAEGDGGGGTGGGGDGGGGTGGGGDGGGGVGTTPPGDTPVVPPVVTPPDTGGNPPADVYGVCDNTGGYNCATGTVGTHSGNATDGWTWYCDGTPNDTAHRSSACFYKPPVTTCGAYSGTDGARPTGACLFNLTPDVTSSGGTYTSTEVVSPSGYTGTDTWSCSNGIWSPGAYTCVAPIYGCMDSTATNYNSHATSQTGITCTYPPAIIYGCMDSTATNYNSHATSQTGITCTYPPAVVYGCTDSNATNYNPSATVDDWSCAYPPAVVATCTLTANPTTIQEGGSSTLHWTTTDMDSSNYFLINQGIGMVSVPSGSQTVSPTVTTIYTGSIWSNAVGVSPSPYIPCEVTITVTPFTPIIPPQPLPATIRVNKVVVNDDGGTKVIADFPLFVDSTAVTSGAVNTFSPGAYTVTETNQPGYAASFSGDCDASGHVSIVAGDHKICTITNNDIAVVVTPPPPPPSSGGGGGGSHRVLPVITLAALPHVGAQPLAYLYLSQIPQTGLDLGPIGTMIYWLVLIGIAFAFAYFVLFGAAPLANRSLRNFGSRVSLALNAQELAPVREMYATPPAPVQHQMSQTFAEAPEAMRGYSSYDGFKSFAQNGALSIEDLVKGLSREHSIRAAVGTIAPAALAPAPRVEPIYEHVEPMYENVEPIMNETVFEKTVIPADVRGFTAALLEGDRLAVFAGLRQHVRGSGASEQLISSVACLLDDAYRARIDGSACDPDIARITARLTTPTLEKLIASLTTAIDSSYSTGVTGAKLALTRALSILGA